MAERTRPIDDTIRAMIERSKVVQAAARDAGREARAGREPEPATLQRQTPSR